MEVFNTLQSSIQELQLDTYPDEIKEQFYTFINGVPFIRNLISPNRCYAKDLPRDNSGKIIVDITKPHILENMDYFRPSALHYQQYGCYTKLRPNKNPNSEYGRWIREEIRRCHEGYVRESDGEWVPGDLYFFWNYCPMQIIKKDSKDSKKANRSLSFPEVWEGHYLKAHYLYQARNSGKHALELASRSKGKSYWGAAMLTKRFILGESFNVNKKVTCYATAAEKKYLVAGDQTLDKFQFNIDFIADNAEFPRRRLINTIQNMQWVMGYLDLDTGTRKGTLNSVIGVTAKDDESKLRGSRGVLYIIEEGGSFPRLLELWNNLLPSVEYGEDVFGLLYSYGTAGDSQSDFYAMSEMMYHPKGYHVYSVDNVYDIEGRSANQFAFFFPGYLNLSNCYDSNGNSDVTKALLSILKDRYEMKYNSTDLNAITKRTAEIPITPQEAIVKTSGNIFPVMEITERINQLDSDPTEFDDVYVGTLIQTNSGKVEFQITNDTPIRDFPTKGNKVPGALEIFKMPERDSQGKIPYDRYILSLDPVDSDQADSMSLSSILVLDLWTDKLVAEYTGRTDFADDTFELLRKLCIFYNGKCMYENNLKGCYSYFSRMNCTHLLADTPEYLKDKDLIKSLGIGNQSKGIHASAPINNYANMLIRGWLIKPITVIERDTSGNEIEVQKRNLFHIRNRALLVELTLFNPQINVDRIRSLGMLMLYREEKLILYGGDIRQSERNSKDKDYLGNDPFFTSNYDDRFVY